MAYTNHWITEESTVYMLLLYEKSSVGDLTPAQVKTLRRLVRKELE